MSTNSSDAVTSVISKPFSRTVSWSPAKQAQKTVVLKSEKPGELRPELKNCKKADNSHQFDSIPTVTVPKVGLSSNAVTNVINPKPISIVNVTLCRSLYRDWL